MQCSRICSAGTPKLKVRSSCAFVLSVPGHTCLPGRRSYTSSLGAIPIVETWEVHVVAKAVGVKVWQACFSSSLPPSTRGFQSSEARPGRDSKTKISASPRVGSASRGCPKFASPRHGSALRGPGRRLNGHPCCSGITKAHPKYTDVFPTKDDRGHIRLASPWTKARRKLEDWLVGFPCMRRDNGGQPVPHGQLIPPSESPL
jgi:hypothetical protein